MSHTVLYFATKMQEVFNDNLYAESVLKPAAHLDMDLRQRRAMRDIKEKNHNLKILAGLSTGSFLLLILCIMTIHSTYD